MGSASENRKFVFYGEGGTLFGIHIAGRLAADLFH